MGQIIIGYTAEGTTDIRLLESILQRTFVAVGMECTQQIEVIDPIIRVDKETGKDFISQIYDGAKKAFNDGIMAFCIHVDADSNDDTDAMTHKINPSFNSIYDSPDTNICKNLIPIIPVRMSEAWMLADKELLKEEIGTLKTDEDLGINRFPESFANPKHTIEEAIRIARSGEGKRRRHTLKISELYQPIGQKIPLESLERLPSYRSFKDAVRTAYRRLNYLQ